MLWNSSSVFGSSHLGPLLFRTNQEKKKINGITWIVNKLVNSCQFKQYKNNFQGAKQYSRSDRSGLVNSCTGMDRLVRVLLCQVLTVTTVTCVLFSCTSPAWLISLHLWCVSLLCESISVHSVTSSSFSCCCCFRFLRASGKQSQELVPYDVPKVLHAGGLFIDFLKIQWFLINPASPLCPHPT